MQTTDSTPQDSTFAAIVRRLMPGIATTDIGWTGDHRALADSFDRVANDPPALDDALRQALQRPESDTGRLVQSVLVRAAATFYSAESNWPAMGYRPLPAGVSWPSARPAIRPIATQVRDSYDVVVVGAGAGGGVSADVLAAAGLDVLAIERGPALAPLDLPPDHQRNHRVSTGLRHQLDFPDPGNPRAIGDDLVDAGDQRWQGNASAVGGGTLVYGAQAWRFTPEDFAMGTTYGAPFLDWPIGYDDLAPYYELVEQTVGVSGSPGHRRHDGPRGLDYPMPPFPDAISTAILRSGAQRAGIGTAAVPLLINSIPFAGRPACVRCGSCVGFSCHANAKNGTMYPLFADNPAPVLPDTVVERLLTDSGGNVVGVRIPGRDIRCRHVVLSAGAVETARLLLISDVGTGHDQVGRYLQAHPYVGAMGIFDEEVVDCVGPGPLISTTDFRHGNPGVSGGGILANEFVSIPVDSWLRYTSAGLIPPFGAESIAAMREIYPRTQHIYGPWQQVPQAESRVTLSTVLDSDGRPVARLQPVPLTDIDHRGLEFMADRAADWLTASGARTVDPRRPGSAPMTMAGQHQAGTARMGTDPASSVTDPYGRVWGHGGVSVADGSLHVTNGGVNPVLTIMALSWRVADRLAADLR